MICKKCGAEHKDSAAFCVGCGADLREVMATEPVPEPVIEPIACKSCGTMIQSNEKFCPKCTQYNPQYNHSAKKPNEIPPPQQPQSFSKPQIIGFVGSLLLILGCFAPILSITVLGTVISPSLLGQTISETGTLMILLAGISLVLSFTRRYKWLYATGVVSLITALWIYFMFTNAITSNSGSRLASSMMVSIGYGLYLLFSGGILLILTPYLQEKGYFSASSTSKSTAEMGDIDKLEKLANLKERGVISEDEFKQQKEELLRFKH